VNTPCSSPSNAVVVTGGASGIGLACATALAEVGRPVAVWDRQGDAAAAAGAALRDGHGIAAIGVAIDVTDDDAVDVATTETAASLGSIGGLVHAAGIVRVGTLSTIDLADWDAVVAVNLRAMVAVGKALLPHLRAAGGGSIVGIGSIESMLGHGSIPGYCASKAGMLGVVRSLADELGGDGIRANLVCPGYVRTPLMEPTLTPEREAALASRSMLGRVAEPVEIGRVVRFLLSDEASYITGTELLVDGGVTHKG
jgi:NAD(P)-dependent dehydrogenase (short-subunit alcohol dehydrogenase family)